jgi:hypothetical protein
MGAVMVECIGIILTILLIVGFIYVWEAIADWRRYRKALKRARARRKNLIEQEKRQERGGRW